MLASITAQGCPSYEQVGTATCLGCHDGRSAPDRQPFTEGAHFANDVSCEACHGPGFLHVRAGGRNGLFINRLYDLAFDDVPNTCAQCHPTEVDGYRQSGHAGLGVATCTDCHDLHVKGTMTRPIETNELCLFCHESLGFVDDDAVDFHTSVFHPVDPAGSGASRCTGCHLPQLEQREPRGGPRDHTLFTIPPMASVEAAEMGILPVPPNSCAGVAGCHDPDFPGGSPRDVNDLDLNRSLQPLYEMIGDRP